MSQALVNTIMKIRVP